MTDKIKGGSTNDWREHAIRTDSEHWADPGSTMSKATKWRKNFNFTHTVSHGLVTPEGVKRNLRLLKQDKNGGSCDRPSAVTVDTWSSLCKPYLKKSSRSQRWLTQISPDGVACLLKNEALSCESEF